MKLSCLIRTLQGALVESGDVEVFIQNEEFDSDWPVEGIERVKMQGHVQDEVKTPFCCDYWRLK